MNTNYENKRLEALELLRSSSKNGEEIPEDLINQVVEVLSGDKEAEKREEVAANQALDMKIIDEQDWKKKAILIAMKISKNLD